jgi:hypothetical protein
MTLGEGDTQEESKPPIFLVRIYRTRRQGEAGGGRGRGRDAGWCEACHPRSQERRYPRVDPVTLKWRALGLSCFSCN